MRTTSYRLRDRVVTVSWEEVAPDRLRVLLPDGECEVRVSRTADGRLRLSRNGRDVVAEAVFDGPELLVGIRGRTFRFHPVDAGGDHEEEHGLVSPRVVAPMPGKVVEVRVREGQQVERGDTLLVLEAMKMETRITAEGPGRVTKVHVQPGQMVDGGALLVELSRQ